MDKYLGLVYINNEPPFKGKWKLIGFDLDKYQFKCERQPTRDGSTSNVRYYDIGVILCDLKTQIETERES